MTSTHSWGRTVVIIVLVGFAFSGFTFPWDKKNQTQKNAQAQRASEKPTLEKMNKQESEESMTSTEGAGEGASADITRLQQELADLTRQTQLIQVQSQADRVKLQQVIERTQVQKQLIETLKVPSPVVTRETVDTEEIIRNTKLRLIAEDVRKSQQTLKVIQQPVAAKAQPVRVPIVPRPKKITT